MKKIISLFLLFIIPFFAFAWRTVFISTAGKSTEVPEDIKFDTEKHAVRIDYLWICDVLKAYDEVEDRLERGGFIL